MNAGAGVLRQLKDNYEVIATGYRQEDEDILVDLGWIRRDRYMVANLLDKQDVAKVVDAAHDLKKELGLPVHLVHYGGASDTKVDLPNNSLLLHTWDMPGEALPDLVANNCVTLLNLLQGLYQKGIFADQEVSKVIFVSAAAAVRVKPMLGLDSAQKGAGHNLIRNIALDLTPERIYITEVMPGSTDTGFFDNDFTLDQAVTVSKKMGYEYDRESYPVFTADQIGDAAKYVLDANCNVREVVLLPYGQFPHLGA